MTPVDLVPEQLWNVIQPLMPPQPPKPKGADPGYERCADMLQAFLDLGCVLICTPPAQPAVGVLSPSVSIPPQGRELHRP
jgi:hypothetical protein